ncbi:MAG: hypothetical protein HYT22_02135 [Candidatus Niyogibacteria bacterium]|nr:hypothetical protein [Candidatus Niyogibacteria bacterium]
MSHHEERGEEHEEEIERESMPIRLMLFGWILIAIGLFAGMFEIFVAPHFPDYKKIFAIAPGIVSYSVKQSPEKVLITAAIAMGAGLVILFANKPLVWLFLKERTLFKRSKKGGT